MALIVQKYGGTSMGSPERILNVAKRIKRWHDHGNQVAVVVSAMCLIRLPAGNIFCSSFGETARSATF